MKNPFTRKARFVTVAILLGSPDNQLFSGTHSMMVAAGALSAHAPQIINGVPISRKKFPALVGLGVQVGKTTSNCSGVVINRSCVLTAKHCLPPFPKWIGVFQSEDILTSRPENTARPESIRYIPGSDIAIVKLKRPMPRTESFVSADLADRDTDVLGERVFIGGYGGNGLGKTEKGLAVLGFGTRRMGNMNVDGIDNTTGEVSLGPSLEEIDSRTFFSILPGDSGGPAIANTDGKTKLIGVASRIRVRVRGEEVQISANTYESVAFHREKIVKALGDVGCESDDETGTTYPRNLLAKEFKGMADYEGNLFKAQFPPGKQLEEDYLKKFHRLHQEDREFSRRVAEPIKALLKVELEKKDPAIVKAFPVFEITGLTQKDGQWEFQFEGKLRKFEPVPREAKLAFFRRKGFLGDPEKLRPRGKILVNAEGKITKVGLN